MVKDQKIDNLIAAAVLWWAEKLTKFSAETNGDRESGGSFLLLYNRLMAHGSEEISEKKVKKFMELLTEHLKEKSKRGGDAILDVDYGPEWPLSDICHKAGVSGVGFPPKTTMWVKFDEGKVTWQTVRGPGGQVYPIVQNQEKEMA
jgi:hypothetical protein